MKTLNLVFFLQLLWSLLIIMWLFLALHECVFCVSAQTQNTPNVSQKTKGKRTKFVLCKSNLSLEREGKKKDPPNNQNKGCVTIWPCHLHPKSILRQKKSYGISNISPCKNIVFKKSSKRNQNPSRYYNPITNLKSQHNPKFHLSKILI